ncbi:hypothetical protein [Pseudoalteromonas obscura]|uniref:Mor transcription activator domain-containing protein n=1 Tax=Pseudoalteromonas obscura TaxID=3048491 RepID=A0ABT7EJQ5_9GAMM|nr:hypothetical protein [Pseudoalteromonas sp. P94(2023)]MDK2595291.1 hypothetical protein [Pseudoalteromonas sp. P94(2023)]
MFLGDDAFVARYQTDMTSHSGNLNEIPARQRRAKPLTLKQDYINFEQRNQAIINAYASGGYTSTEIGDYFGLHYSRVSRIVAKGKI